MRRGRAGCPSAGGLKSFIITIIPALRRCARGMQGGVRDRHPLARSSPGHRDIHSRAEARRKSPYPGHGIKFRGR